MNVLRSNLSPNAACVASMNDRDATNSPFAAGEGARPAINREPVAKYEPASAEAFIPSVLPGANTTPKTKVIESTCAAPGSAATAGVCGRPAFWKTTPSWSPPFADV